ncbi:hypothetical protein B0H19DRAFT_1275722 [Mycena capillaripes]|nr:hypothetical protein B0H19DRAFT_1275722 [Mycena capillaripes]
MPAVCTKVLRHLSSLLMPVLVRPPLKANASPTTIEKENRRLAEEESECTALNARVCHLQTQTVKHLKFIHAREDYEEIYGKFLPDADNETWHACKDAALAQLYELRNNALFCSPIANRMPIKTYVDAFDAFLAEFDSSFKIEDKWTSMLASTITVMKRYNRLLERCEGDTDRMEKYVSRCTATFTVINPFGMDDPRRLELDTLHMLCLISPHPCLCSRCRPVRRRLEEMLRDLGNRRVIKAVTRNDIRFVFTLNNKFADAPHTTNCVKTYIPHQVWREEMRGVGEEAKICAGEPTPAWTMGFIPASMFYGRS